MCEVGACIHTNCIKNNWEKKVNYELMIGNVSISINDFKIFKNTTMFYCISENPHIYCGPIYIQVPSRLMSVSPWICDGLFMRDKLKCLKEVQSVHVVYSSLLSHPSLFSVFTVTSWAEWPCDTTLLLLCWHIIATCTRTSKTVKNILCELTNIKASPHTYAAGMSILYRASEVDNVGEGDEQQTAALTG